MRLCIFLIVLLVSVLAFADDVIVPGARVTGLNADQKRLYGTVVNGFDDGSAEIQWDVGGAPTIWLKSTFVVAVDQVTGTGSVLKKGLRATGTSSTDQRLAGVIQNVYADGS